VRLSINGRPKQRKFTVNGAEFDFTHGFEDLHAESYRRIIAGHGFGLEDALPSILLCERIMNRANSGE
jgi:UDP-N-acetyl-2-amino-2-deoxyglucuronate dehydrogenase